MATNTLGSVAGEVLMKQLQVGNHVAYAIVAAPHSQLQPAYWFAAHLHVKFAAMVTHPPSTAGKAKHTRFLALDKCLPRRDFLQVVRVPVRPSERQATDCDRLCFDPEWLAILRARYVPLPQVHRGADKQCSQPCCSHTMIPPHHVLARQRNKTVHLPPSLPPPSDADVLAARQCVARAFGAHASGELPVPENFVVTVPTHDPATSRRDGRGAAPCFRTGNPQTDELLAALGLQHHLTVPFGHRSTTQVERNRVEPTLEYSAAAAAVSTRDAAEIDIDDVGAGAGASTADAAEIDIDDDDSSGIGDTANTPGADDPACIDLDSV